jgi:GH15 family glucan-1,4-alpha-glucosidase
MNCWRALTRAAQLADGGHIPGPRERWSREADVIRDWIERNCWSERQRAYTFHAGTDRLDASVLLAAKFGYERGPRMSSTIDALRRELSAGPLLYRYSGVEREEQTFIACAYWSVEALALVGRVDEARALMRELEPLGNDLGLLAEMAEPGSFALAGNLPQALSHLAFIGAAFALRTASANPQPSPHGGHQGRHAP